MVAAFGEAEIGEAVGDQDERLAGQVAYLLFRISVGTFAQARIHHRAAVAA